MRLKLFRVFAFIAFLSASQTGLYAQSCMPTNINGTVIDRACGQLCADVTLRIPHFKGTEDYTVSPIPYAAYPYNNPGGTTIPSIYVDDKYSPLIPMGFPFCFYGLSYNEVVVGSNGILTFEQLCANASNAYTLTVGGVPQPLPYNGGTGPSGIGTTYYPRTAIMGAYHDIDPSASPLPTRRIEYNVVGTAPCRKFVVSFLDIRMFSCNTQICTEQIVLHESTGVIEVFLLNKPLCTSWPSGAGAGLAILGIQDHTRTKYCAPLGKNCTQWTESNTGYRFTPSGGTSRFVSSELYTMGGALVATADTATTTAGLLDLNFPNICVSGTSTSFVVKTTLSACGTSAPLVSLDTITVNLTSMDANVTPAATSCNGANNGSVLVTPTTGSAPFTFILDGGTPVISPTPYTFTNLSAGSHSVVVRDAFGCSTSPIPVQVNAGPPLSATATAVSVSCNGTATGSITVAQPAAGNAPYEYSLDGVTWQSSNVFNGLAAGTYTVHFRERDGCTGTVPVTVNEPAVLTASTGMVPVVCNGQSNGTVTINGAGGVAPYQYSVDGIVWQSGNSFSLPAGNYTIRVRDFNNCLNTYPVTVTEPAALQASSVNTNATCDGGLDGGILVSAAGGNTSYTYSIDGSSFQSSPGFNVAPGTYTVTVKDNLGCTTSFPAVVGLTDNMTWTPQADPTICESKSVQLTLVSNATQYAWSPSTGLSATDIYNPVANPVQTTQYVVTATLGRCSHDDTVIVQVNAAPVPDAGEDGFICYGQNYRLQPSGGVQYRWSPSSYLDNPNTGNALSTPAKDIVYTLSVIADQNGCASLVTDSMRIDVTPPIKVKTYPYDTIGYPGDQFQLLVVPSDTDVIHYTWNPTIGLSNPEPAAVSGLDIPNPVVSVGAVGQDVQYQVIASTIAGCKGEGYITVRVYKGPDIYVPTGFSPNGDGKNDRFTPFPVGMKSYTYFRVFNRWGQLVFSTSKLNDGWDGRFGGVEQGSGVYVWMIEGMTKDNRLITKKGTVMLIR